VTVARVDPQTGNVLVGGKPLFPIGLSDDIAVSARATAAFLYLIAIRKSPTATGRVHFQGLPTAIIQGTVLAHPGGNPARNISVAQGAFTDPSPYEPHNARVYRFPRST
jgi:hypothetical protein